MKKYIALAWVCLALTDVMAQKQKVVEKVVDEDYYPVEGAVVTLKRTNQNATTDKDGVFILEEVPVYFDSLQVKKGKRSGYIDLPMVGWEPISGCRNIGLFSRHFCWFPVK